MHFEFGQFVDIGLLIFVFCSCIRITCEFKTLRPIPDWILGGEGGKRREGSVGKGMEGRGERGGERRDGREGADNQNCAPGMALQKLGLEQLFFARTGEVVPDGGGCQKSYLAFSVPIYVIRPSHGGSI